MIGMDHIVHEPLESCLHNEDGDKVGPEKLLEDRWFFRNLLDRKTRMRISSDPCTSSDNSRENLPGKSYEETYEAIKKLSAYEESRMSNLVRAPSMPTPCMERKGNNPWTEGSDPAGRRKSNQKTSSKNLVRAPSLPSSVEAEEFQDEEMEFSMGKLIRQASLNSPQRAYAAKDVTASSSISTHQSRRRPELDSLRLEKIRPQCLMNQIQTQKSLSALDHKEFLGSKESGLDFDKKDLKPGEISIIPGLQEKKRTEDEGKNRSRLHRSQSWALPVPKSDSKRSTEEDMKAQIKFWARAVASNVRQES